VLVVLASGASLAAGAVVLLVAASLGYDIRDISRTVFRFGQSGPPVYEWVQSEDKTFDFLPGEGKAWGPVTPQGGEIRYVINAFLPLDTGLMDSAKWTDSMEGWRVMKTSSICYERKITSASKICRMPNDKPYLIFMRDVRAKQLGPGALENGAVSQKLQEQNNVRVTILTRQCVENCR
jgi:hypothetical protein